MTKTKQRASVITMHSVCNYGTQLQAYATQKKLEESFDEVFFVNYKRFDTYGKGLRQTYAQGNPIRWLAFLPTYFRWKHVFGKFQKEHLSITKQTYLEQKDFDKHPIKADVYFSGSDQVWNTGWNRGVIPAYYLSYAPNDKPKFALSSSFGQSELGQSEIPTIRSYLRRFQKISVREKSGLDIIKNQLKLKAIQLNDPTLAFSGDFWRRFKTKKTPKEKYILIYNLNNNAKMDSYAQEVADLTGYTLYRFCTRYDQVIKNGKSLVIPNVEDFVTYIDDAELVITDSFHATAFSMNLNTKAIVLLPEKYSSRLQDFLKQIHNTQCIAKDYDDLSPLYTHTDFKKVNTILKRERERFDKFMQEIKEEL